LNSGFVSQYERGAESSGIGTRTSGKFILIGGIPGYERRGLFTANGQQVPNVIRLICASGKLYAIQAIENGADAGDDPEIQKALASFRFLEPPAVQVKSPKPPLSRIRGLLHRLLRFKLAIVGASAFLLILVAALAMYVSNRKGKRHRRRTLGSHSQ
jgi:hypothetical protein